MGKDAITMLAYMLVHNVTDGNEADRLFQE